MLLVTASIVDERGEAAAVDVGQDRSASTRLNGSGQEAD
jgi:hypothetical protein